MVYHRFAIAGQRRRGAMAVAGGQAVTIGAGQGGRRNTPKGSICPHRPWSGHVGLQLLAEAIHQRL